MKDLDWLEVEQAQKTLLTHAKPCLRDEEVALACAGGRVLLSGVDAALDQPLFDRSPLDGYAVHHLDLVDATETTPVSLLITQTIYAGDTPSRPLARGEAARVTTGAAMPSGATCVAWQEDSEIDGDTVLLHCRQDEGDNIVRKGSDASAGQLVAKAGERLNSVLIGLLASQGIASVMVADRPKIGIIATGSELTKSGLPLPAGRIYDSNGFMLSERVRELGGAPIHADSVPDQPKELAREIRRLAGECDLIVTTGGVSIGPRDYMEMAGELLEAERLFHGIDAKPGSPVLALAMESRLLLCLSGNPFAAFVTFELLAAPIIRRLAGETTPIHESVVCVLQNEFPKKSPGRRFVRARMRGAKAFIPPGSHESGALMALAGCNCLLDIPPGSPALMPGAAVKAIPI